MATPIDMARLRNAMADAMRDVAASVRGVMDERGLNATGQTMRGVRTSAVVEGGGVTGTLEADGHWRYVGSGRGPGGRPPVSRIEAWLTAKGLDLSPWAVAVKIGREGSRDWRLKRPNAFLQGAERWERGDGLARLGDEAADVYGNGAADVIVTNLR